MKEVQSDGSEKIRETKKDEGQFQTAGTLREIGIVKELEKMNPTGNGRDRGCRNWIIQVPVSPDSLTPQPFVQK